MKNYSRTPPLSLEQYTRIHNVVHSLSKFFSKDVGKACVFFSLTGAALMHLHYKKNAKMICGLGAVVVHKGTKPTVISWFKMNDEGHCFAAEDAFHAWVECDGWVIDFMAPNYEEALRSSSAEGKDLIPTLPRMMLQKPAEHTGVPMSKLTRAGRAVFQGDPDVSRAIIDGAFERPSTGDVVNIALEWHRPFPMPMMESLTIQNDLGNVTTIPLLKRNLVGAW